MFKQFAWKMQEKGHVLRFTVRDKEHETALLTAYGFAFSSFGRHYRSKIGKIWGLVKFNTQLLQVARRFQPDLFLSHGSIYAAQVSALLRKPHISLEDTGNMEQIRLYRPFTEAILTPDVLPEKLGQNQIRYAGYHELMYLLPAYYSPQDSIYEVLGLPPGSAYAILRFISWDATHDTGQGGLTLTLKRKLIEELSPRLAVFISSEAALSEEFRHLQIRIPPERIHDALAYATLFVGEGATMASESGILGTPAVYVNSLARCYCQDQEKYGLVFNFRSSQGVLEKVEELSRIPDIKSEWGRRRARLWREKIDVTAFLVWFVEHFPESRRILRENPDYQWKFKVQVDEN